jgi:hypothetical protein
LNYGARKVGAFLLAQVKGLALKLKHPKVRNSYMVDFYQKVSMTSCSLNFECDQMTPKSEFTWSKDYVSTEDSPRLEVESKGNK